MIGRQVDSLPREEQRCIKEWLSYSRATLSLKAFGQCGEAELSLDRRMRDFDEFSCCKESVKVFSGRVVNRCTRSNCLRNRCIGSKLLTRFESNDPK